MYQAATESFKDSDVAILCAAVADFRPETQAMEKIKREKLALSGQRGSSDMTLRLVPNPDIAATLGQMKQKGQVLVGFALETNDEEQNAKKKLEKKNLDFIVLNSLQNKGTCFQSDENQISIISHDGKKDYEKKSKQEVARDIVDEIHKRINGTVKG
jgi:phosphopantothenoylcysteine decarboxylase/phosphopantothenate--cysteine ligase